MENKTHTPFIDTSMAIIIGSVIIALSILGAGGNFQLQGYQGTRKATTTTDSATGGVKSNQEKLADLAEGIDLDGKKLLECVNKNDDSEIKKDLSDATAYGADGTPTFFIGMSTGSEISGVKVVGAQPTNVFKTIIDEALAGKTPEATGSTEIMNVSLDDDPVLGDKSAPVTMVEFSDYECPFCKRYFDSTYPELKRDYIDTGKVKVVFRDLPLSFHDPVATIEAVAANCAREQGGDESYFKMHNAIFSATKSNGEGV